MADDSMIYETPRIGSAEEWRAVATEKCTELTTLRARVAGLEAEAAGLEPKRDAVRMNYQGMNRYLLKRLADYEPWMKEDECFLLIGAHRPLRRAFVADIIKPRPYFVGHQEVLACCCVAHVATIAYQQIFVNNNDLRLTNKGIGVCLRHESSRT